MNQPEVEKNLYFLVRKWWKEINDPKDASSLKRDRAEIKRCATLLDIQLLPGFYNMKNRLADLSVQIPTNEQLALIAGILVHIKTELVVAEKMPRQSQTLAKLMGKKKNDSTMVSTLRFRRILQTTNIEDLYRRLIRVLPLIEYQAYLRQLIWDLSHWDDDTRRKWAEAYYSN